MSIAHSPPENTAIFNAVNESAIGIDVHADLYVAVYQQCSFGAKNVVGHRKFTKGATKADIDELARWCVNLHPQVILMESTGVYWQALYEGLERAGFNQSNIAVVNARDVKNKKGSKTDYKKSYAEAWEKEFRHARDWNQCRGEQNVFRYLPVKGGM